MTNSHIFDAREAWLCARQRAIKADASATEAQRLASLAWAKYMIAVLHAEREIKRLDKLKSMRDWPSLMRAQGE